MPTLLAFLLADGSYPPLATVVCFAVTAVALVGVVFVLVEIRPWA